MNAFHSPASVQANPQGASIVQVETSRFLPWMVLAVLLAGFGLGMSIMTAINQATAYRELERENRLAQLKIDEFRMALITAGIDPNPHAEGESK